MPRLMVFLSLTSASSIHVAQPIVNRNFRFGHPARAPYTSAHSSWTESVMDRVRGRDDCGRAALHEDLSLPTIPNRFEREAGSETFKYLNTILDRPVPSRP